MEHVLICGGLLADLLLMIHFENIRSSNFISSCSSHILWYNVRDGDLDHWATSSSVASRWVTVFMLVNS